MSQDPTAKPIVKEVLIKAPPAKVWKAITDKEDMKQWYFTIEEFRPEAGFEFEFSGKGQKGESYLHLCRITEVIPLKKLQYTWRLEVIPYFQCSEASASFTQPGFIAALYIKSKDAYANTRRKDQWRLGLV